MSTEMITKQEAEQIAQAAADAAVQKLFLSLDLDIGDAKEVRRFRDDLNFLKTQREGSDHIKSAAKKSVVYVVTTAAVGFLYFSWDIFRDGFHAWLADWIGRGGN